MRGGGPTGGGSQVGDNGKKKKKRLNQMVRGEPSGLFGSPVEPLD